MNEKLDLINIKDGEMLHKHIWNGIDHYRVPSYVLITILEVIKQDIIRQMTEGDD